MNFLAKSLILIIVCTNAFAANSNEQRYENLFEKLHQHAVIHCEYKFYKNVPKITILNQSFVKKEKVEAQFNINNKKLNILVTPSKKVMQGREHHVAKIDFNLAGTKFDITQLKNNEIEISNSSLNGEQQSLYNTLKLNDLLCSMRLATENTLTLTNKNVHIAMHPQSGFDYNSGTGPVIEKLLKDESIQQIVMIDDYFKKAKNLNVAEFILTGASQLLPNRERGLPELVIPEKVPLYVAPAGHNVFNITHDNQQITYTGGNHNFCILNNTLRAFNAVFETENVKNIIINYPINAILVQKKSHAKGMSFKWRDIKRNNSMKAVFEKIGATATKNYLNALLKHIEEDYIPKKIYYFKTLTITQNSLDPQTKVYEGKGTGEYSFTINYTESN